MNKKDLDAVRQMSEPDLRAALRRHDLTVPEHELLQKVLHERVYGKKAKPPQWTQN